MRTLTFIILLLTLAGCQSDENVSTGSYQEIAGRDLPADSPPYSRQIVYRAKVPSEWIRIDPTVNDSISDTMKPLCEFQIKEGTETIRITIHNFPTDNIEDRIPPEVQIARWRRQFTLLDPAKAFVVPQARGGFAGLQFEGTGIFKGDPATMLGWSMQLANEHYRTLKAIDRIEGKGHYKQMSADYTIKASGPVGLMEKNRESIIEFAKSFELINEIPSHS